jgi:hypothetical protein
MLKLKKEVFTLFFKDDIKKIAEAMFLMLQFESPNEE